MNYKRIFINTTLIFIICSLFHFVYDFFPNFFTSLFFPVNESVWEHLKLISTSTLVFTFISNYYYHDKNVFIKTYLRSILTIIILLIIYLPINYFLGEIVVVTLIILFISIFISELIISKIPSKKHYKTYNIISAILIILNLFSFMLLTYYPLKLDLFLDKQSNKYGIDILNK